MIDEYSRLSVAEVIEDKKPETVLNMIMTKWICVFGTPKRMLNDRGGEFQNTQLLNFLNVMGIQSRPISAYSPFTNGVVERHNGVLKATLDKVITKKTTSKADKREWVLRCAMLCTQRMLCWTFMVTHLS